MEKNEIIYGKNAVSSALESGKRNINKIFIAKGVKHDQKVHEIIKTARINKIIVQEVPKEKLNSLAPGAHQGVAASVSPIEYLEFNEFRKNLKGKEKLSTIIILDGVEDPHNLGSIIRTAYAAGAEGIIISKRRSVPVTGIVEKASAGCVEKIPIVQVSNLSNAIDKLKEDGFWIIGAESSGEKYYFETDFNMNCALVMGSEGQGISPIVKKNCDILVKIPMVEGANSLNVSNALSVIVYEIVRQRIVKK